MQKWQNKIDILQGRLGQLVNANTEEEAESVISDAMMEEAIAESLSDEDEKVVSSVVEESIAANNNQVCHVPPSAPANASLPRPALRFVRDITYPDGIVIAPGTVFSKIWRIRNDGPCDWPEGVTLCNAGGDILSDPAHREPLPPLPSGSEAEVSVQLRAPECYGRFISYFKAQTAMEQGFGQRLWCNVVVSDEGEEWHVVTESVEDELETAKLEEMAASVSSNTATEPATATATTATATTATEPTTATATTATATDSMYAFKNVVLSNLQTDSVFSMLDQLRARAGPGVVADAATTAAAAANVQRNDQEADVLLDEAYTVTFPYEEDDEVALADMLRRATAGANVWQRELQLLRDMGFVDQDVLIPLLEQFCNGTDTASFPAACNAEGMQQVVATLLMNLR
jgi:hypothetical protein